MRARPLASLSIACMLAVACAAPAPPGPATDRPASASATPSAPATSGWTQIPPGSLDGVELGPVVDTADGRLLALGQKVEPTDGSIHISIWTSPDGTTWERQPDSPAFQSVREHWNRVPVNLLRSADGYVAVGLDQFADGSQADAAAWFSTDGVAWTSAVVGQARGRTLDEVVRTSTGLVAFGARRYDLHGGFGDGTAIWTSADGRSWTKLPDDQVPPLGVRLRDVTPFDRRWLALAGAEVSQDGRPRQPVTDGIWSSDDGVTWAPVPATPLRLRSLIASPDGLAALRAERVVGAANDLPSVWRSSDGTAWTRDLLPDPPGLPTGSSLVATSLAAIPGGWLAAGERDDGNEPSVIWTSPDGARWTGAVAGPWGDTRIIRLEPLAAGILMIAVPMDGAGPPSTWLLVP